MFKKVASRFFRWFCRAEYYEDIEGDLEELYNERMQLGSSLHAELGYAKEVLLLFRPSIIKRISMPPISSSKGLVKQNVRLAFRQISRHTMSSSIKIFGLTVGITACLLLSFYLKHELSYDTQFPESDRIFRVTVHYQKEDIRGVDFPAPFSKALKSDFPEIEQTSRFLQANWLHHIRKPQDATNEYEKGFAYADPELIEIFRLPMIYGDSRSALEEPQSIIISERKAKKFFPGVNPIGQSVILNNDNSTLYQITGVFEDRPNNSHLQFDFLISLTNIVFFPGEDEYWGANIYSVYSTLLPGSDAQLISEKMASMSAKYFVPSFMARDFSNPEELGANMKYDLQPVRDIYLNKIDVSDDLPHGDVRLYWLLGIAGLLILLIACINFVNLSTASANTRAKEIGVRKVSGATKGHLINQFLTESILFTFLSLLLGCLLTWLILPHVAVLAPIKQNFLLYSLEIIPLLLVTMIVIGICSGLYPSLYLAKFKPISTIKQTPGAGGKDRFSHSFFVAFQFTASVALIICSSVVYQQMQFILDKEIGFDKDQVLVINGAQLLGEKTNAFKEELLRQPGIQRVAASDFLPIEGASRYADSFWQEGTQTLMQGVNAQIWSVDYDYVPTLGLHILEGRNFSRTFASDSSAIIISASLAKQLGLENPVGQRLTNKTNTWQIVGVMEDFHFESLRTPLSPSSLVIGVQASTLSIRFDGEERTEILATVEQTWNEFVSTTPMRFEFLGESFAHMHNDVENSATLFNSFSVTAILIACLGLFGLMRYITEQRKREMGIRKVLGATETNIAFLLSRDYMKPIIISLFIGIPLAWYVMQQWLYGFAFRTEIDWWIFLFAGGVTLAIALVTVSYHLLKTALTNPIDIIRYG